MERCTTYVRSTVPKQTGCDGKEKESVCARASTTRKPNTHVESVRLGPHVSVVAGDRGLGNAPGGQQVLVHVILPRGHDDDDDVDACVRLCRTTATTAFARSSDVRR